MMKDAKLIVLRGPSGSGKSSIAKAVQERFVAKGGTMAYIEQDHFRRIVLKERDVPNGFNHVFIKEMVLFLLQHDHNVIMEGIFDKGRYEHMFMDIIAKHTVHIYFFYLDISLKETIKRHATKPCKHDFGEKELRSWYKEKDLLACTIERIISEETSLDDSVHMIEKLCKI